MGQHQLAASTELHDALGALLDDVEPVADRSVGVLITIDEIHTVDPDELRQIGLAAQYHRRQDEPVVAATAGLPTHDMSGLFADPAIASFLQRSYRPSVTEIALLSGDDVRQGLIENAALGQRTFASSALDAAVAVIDGYPYLLQLVGFDRSVNPATRAASSDPTSSKPCPSALTKYGRTVTELTASRLSPVDRPFLAAMALDPLGAGTRLATSPTASASRANTSPATATG